VQPAVAAYRGGTGVLVNSCNADVCKSEQDAREQGTWRTRIAVKAPLNES
jgi:hypothetical protein